MALYWERSAPSRGGEVTQPEPTEEVDAQGETIIPIGERILIN